MNASLSAAVLLVAAILASGCRTGLPAIALTPRGQNVRVVYDQHDVAAGCRTVAHLSAEDGITEGPGHYSGSVERAVLRLRNNAADVGANMVLLLSSRRREDPGYVVTEVAVDCPKCGQTVVVSGTAYACE